MKRINVVLLVLSVLTIPRLAFAQDDESLALEAVQQFFDGMAASDPVISRAVLMEGGQFYATRQDPDGLFIRQSNFEEYISNIESNTSALLERMWDPHVSVTGWLAVVTTPYDFHIDGKFSHCGTDVFNLIKTNDGWQISSAMYSIEPTGCEPSPLGEPEF